MDNENNPIEDTREVTYSIRSLKGSDWKNNKTEQLGYIYYKLVFL